MKQRRITLVPFVTNKFNRGAIIAKLPYTHLLIVRIIKNDILISGIYLHPLSILFVLRMTFSMTPERA